jgi:hypothetical protein
MALISLSFSMIAEGVPLGATRKLYDLFWPIHSMKEQKLLGYARLL